MDNAVLYAYLAGAVDADGYVTISRHRRSVGAQYGHQPIYYSARLGLSETSAIIPELLLDTFGGSLWKYQPKNASHKLWYTWCVTNDKAAEAARLLLPYLRLKQRQGELLLDFVQLIKQQKSDMVQNQLPPYRITDEMQSSRYALWSAITRLNAPRNKRVHFLEEPDETSGLS